MYFICRGGEHQSNSVGKGQQRQSHLASAGTQPELEGQLPNFVLKDSPGRTQSTGVYALVFVEQ